VGADGEHHKWLTGIITEARILRDKGELQQHEADLLEDIYEWFNEHLPCPPFSTAKWPKAAVTWFKDEADKPINKMWELVSLLEQHGLPVRMLYSKTPGKILYEDEYQVVVEEWNRI